MYERRFYTSRELASRWRCDRETILRRKRSGAIPKPLSFSKHGGDLLWAEDQILAFENAKMAAERETTAACLEAAGECGPRGDTKGNRSQPMRGGESGWETRAKPQERVSNEPPARNY
jgi:hypothetical protein